MADGETRDEVEEDPGVLEAEDTLDDRGLSTALDEGYSPPERPWAVRSWGVTAAEQHQREPLAERLAREQGEVAAPEGDGLGDLLDSDGELLDDEVGDARAGRLVAWEGVTGDPGTESDLFARDVGIDGAAASAEEAAVHVVTDDTATDELP
ncbi:MULTISPECIES: DUF5709 domain-containing protein [Streptomyces]|uniref:DUF5709 domain-containing protein n=1 Tax=Streptomyces dengpaensis TaxID=2049881 RepID=A0ABM6SK29_9ACTN|nr:MULTISPECIES: DUF5709 domain-containing protein [Streptomyces]AVH54743.1 hypothetical protein C4B68_01745 [Streptomyces dengpaensis]PIB03847.1 hypothetical protein B1C81_35685 [Streptomyces sp. HG99]